MTKADPGSAPIRPSVRPMAPLLLEEEDRRPSEDLNPELQGVSKPQTGEDFFDDAEQTTGDEEP